MSIPLKKDVALGMTAHVYMNSTTKYVYVPPSSNKSQQSIQKPKQSALLGVANSNASKKEVQNKAASKSPNMRTSGLQVSKLSDLGPSALFQGLDGLNKRPIQYTQRSKSKNSEQIDNLSKDNSKIGANHFQRRQRNKLAQSPTSKIQYDSSFKQNSNLVKTGSNLNIQQGGQQKRKDNQKLQTSYSQVIIRKPGLRLEKQQQTNQNDNKLTINKNTNAVSPTNKKPQILSPNNKLNQVNSRVNKAKQESFGTQTTSSYVYKPQAKHTTVQVHNNKSIQAPLQINTTPNANKQEIKKVDTKNRSVSNSYAISRSRQKNQSQMDLEINTQVSYFKIQMKGGDSKRSSVEKVQPKRPPIKAQEKKIVQSQSNQIAESKAYQKPKSRAQLIKQNSLPIQENQQKQIKQPIIGQRGPIVRSNIQTSSITPKTQENSEEKVEEKKNPTPYQYGKKSKQELVKQTAKNTPNQTKPKVQEKSNSVDENTAVNRYQYGKKTKQQLIKQRESSKVPQAIKKSQQPLTNIKEQKKPQTSYNPYSYGRKSKQQLVKEAQKNNDSLKSKSKQKQQTIKIVQQKKVVTSYQYTRKTKEQLVKSNEDKSIEANSKPIYPNKINETNKALNNATKNPSKQGSSSQQIQASNQQIPAKINPKIQVKYPLNRYNKQAINNPQAHQANHVKVQSPKSHQKNQINNSPAPNNYTYAKPTTGGYTYQPPTKKNLANNEIQNNQKVEVTNLSKQTPNLNTVNNFNRSKQGTPVVSLPINSNVKVLKESQQKINSPKQAKKPAYFQRNKTAQIKPEAQKLITPVKNTLIQAKQAQKEIKQNNSRNVTPIYAPKNSSAYSKSHNNEVSIKQSNENLAQEEKKAIPNAAFSIFNILIKKKIKSNLRNSFQKINTDYKISKKREKYICIFAKKSLSLIQNYEIFLKQQTLLNLKKKYMSSLSDSSPKDAGMKQSRMVGIKNQPKVKQLRQDSQLQSLVSKTKSLLSLKLNSIFNLKLREVFKQKIVKNYHIQNYYQYKQPIFSSLSRLFTKKSIQSTGNIFKTLKFMYHQVPKRGDEDVLPLFETKNKKLSKQQIYKFFQNIYHNQSFNQSKSRILLIDKTPQKSFTQSFKSKQILTKNKSNNVSESAQSIKAESQKILSLRARIEALQKQINQQQKLGNDKQRQITSKKLQIKRQINTLKKENELKKTENQELTGKLKQLQNFDNLIDNQNSKRIGSDDKIISKDYNLLDQNMFTLQSNGLLTMISQIYVDSLIKPQQNNPQISCVDDFISKYSEANPILSQCFESLVSSSSQLSAQKQIIQEHILIRQNMFLKNRILMYQAEYIDSSNQYIDKNIPKIQQEVDTIKHLVKNYLKQRYLWEWIRKSIEKI